MNRVGRVLLCGACVVFLSLVSLVRPAHAESITFRGSGHAAAVGITVVNGTTTLFSGNVMAGELNWSWVGTAPAGYATDIYTYCIDATQYLQWTQAVDVRSTTAFTGGSTDAGAKVSWLINKFGDGIRTAGTNTQAAALQVAIWEALYDSSSNLGNGSFRMTTTDGVRTQAEAYLSALYSSNYAGSSATWLDTNAGQDQLTRSVPEPATILVMGLAGIYAMRRRQSANV